MPTATSIAIPIGTAIKRERSKRKLSQSELETRSGVPKARISRYEHGHTVPALPTLIALADGLEVTPSVLLRRAGF